MKVSDIIASALALIGRKELVPYVSNPSAAGDEDADEVISTLLYCFNSVEDEIARNYIPLVVCEEMTSANNKFAYADFKKIPVKIKKVTKDGQAVPFKVLKGYMEVKASRITVEYEYVPGRKKIADDSDFGCEVGEYLIALGMASEYCIINCEAEMADRWEKKYRERLDEARSTLPVCASIPPRRWV